MDVGAFSVIERFVILVGDGFNNLHARRNVFGVNSGMRGFQSI